MEIRLGLASILSWLMIINQLTRFMNLNLVEVLGKIFKRTFKILK